MLKGLMAKLGVGSAKVDLVLSKPEFALGEVIYGEFRIEGGTVEQAINKLDVDLLLKMNVKGKEYSQTVTSIPVSSAFTVQPKEQKVLPFTYQLPANLPVSRDGVMYSLLTRLDIDAGKDSLDQDRLRVTLPAKFNNVVRALELLGFREKATSGRFNGYTQKFEFFPTTAHPDKVKEVEFEAAIEEQGIRLLLEVDLAALAFGLGEKEIRREVFLYNEILDDVQGLSAHLKGLIEEMLRNPQLYTALPYSQSYRQGHHGGLMGGIGGLAAGMFGGMLLADLMGGGEGEEEDSGGDEGGFGDFFGGDEE